MGDTADFLVKISDPRVRARVIHDGPLLTTPECEALAPPRTGIRYVYMLLSDGWATYIGMSQQPSRRLEVHRRRDWFADVDGYIIVELVAEHDWQAKWAALATEGSAIRMFGPTANVAGVDRFGS